MAFLCPVRIRRNKKKKLEEDTMRSVPSMGRITGSASIETLVRVGLEKEAGLGPESKMVVLHDFSPCVDDELEVRRGQIVHVLYQENDWVYVISEDSREGFIPHSYTAQFGSQLAGLALNVKKKMPRDHQGLSDTGGLLSELDHGGRGPHMEGDLRGNNREVERNNNSSKVNNGMDNSDTDSFQDGRNHGSRGLNLTSQSRSSSLLSESSSQPEVHPFFKDPYGRYIVLYTYTAQDENDLSVERGQCVTVLNKDDPEWFWVLRSDGCEGFVPAGFVYPLDAIQKQQALSAVSSGNSGHPGGESGRMQGGSEGRLLGGSEGGRMQGVSEGVQGRLQQGSEGVSSQATTPRTQIPTPSSVPVNPLSQLNINGHLVSSGPLSSVSVTSGPHSSSHQSNQSGHLSSLTSSAGSGPNSLSPGNQGGGPPTHQGGAHTTHQGGGSGTPVHLPGQGGGVSGPPSGNEIRYGGTELVMLYDYKAQAPDDLSVRRGDWVYADLENQTVDGWLWAYAPKTRKYGFIPKAYARPPAMTSL